ncbi:uncharacterized protein LOC119641036 isoform X1 [Glossina fuscipes]|uniref:Uncharacterized protein LOC119641036 isoform X1 n=2 Tax=Glossina fuscipes TaxID=7396 RepID=A0A9C6DXM3_9MUSC|nr:uncharacterized protein LOC119641036 isoform X1 [Glossina fuscipes]
MFSLTFFPAHSCPTWFFSQRNEIHFKNLYTRCTKNRSSNCYIKQSRHQMMKLCSSCRSSTLLNIVIDQRLRIDTCRYLIEILSRRLTGE